MTKFSPPTDSTSGANRRAFNRAVTKIERHRGPVVVTGFGHDLYKRTAQARARRGTVLRFDPFQLAGEPSDTWSPLAGADTWDGALDVAWQLALAAMHDQRAIEARDFWAILVEERLAPMLHAAARSGGKIEQLTAWAYGQDTRSFTAAIDQIIASADTSNECADAHHIYRNTEEFAESDDRTRLSVEASIQGLLRAYRFSRVAQSATSTDILASTLFSGSNTVYLVGDPKASKLLRPLMTTLLEQLVTGALDSNRKLLLAETEGQLVTVENDGLAVHNLTHTGKVARLTVPALQHHDAPVTPTRRRLRFRTPITLA